MDRERQTERIRIGWRYANTFNNQLAEANQFSFLVLCTDLLDRQREMEGVKRTVDMYCHHIYLDLSCLGNGHNIRCTLNLKTG